MSKSKLIKFEGFAPEETHKGPHKLALAHNVIPTREGFRAFERVGHVSTATSTADDIHTGTLGPGIWTGLYNLPARQQYNYDIGLAFVPGSGVSDVYVRNQLLGTDPWVHVEQIPDAGAGYKTQCIRFGNYILYKTFDYARAISTDGIFTAVPPTTLTSAPRYARTMVAAQRFVMMLGRVDSSPVYDGWYCSARDDHTSWTLSPATLCAKGRLTDTAGDIVAAVEFNGDVIAAKQSALYRGRFVPGSAEVWEWEKLPFKISLQRDAHNAMVTTKHGVVICDYAGVHLYDGATLELLFDYSNLRQFSVAGTGTAEYITAPDAASRLSYSPGEDVLYIFRAASVGFVDATLLWMCHLPTRRWSTALVRGSSFAVTEIPPNGKAGIVKSNTTAGTTGTWRTYRNVFAQTDVQHLTFSSPRIVTGDIGDDFADSELTEARLHARGAISTASCVHYYRNSLRSAFVTKPAVGESAGKFELRQVAKWHRLLFETVLPPAASATGYASEVFGIRLVMENAGETGED